MNNVIFFPSKLLLTLQLNKITMEDLFARVDFNNLHVTEIDKFKRISIYDLNYINSFNSILHKLLLPIGNKVSPLDALIDKIGRVHTDEVHTHILSNGNKAKTSVISLQVFNAFDIIVLDDDFKFVELKSNHEQRKEILSHVTNRYKEACGEQMALKSIYVKNLILVN